MRVVPFLLLLLGTSLATGFGLRCHSDALTEAEGRGRSEVRERCVSVLVPLVLEVDRLEDELEDCRSGAGLCL